MDPPLPAKINVDIVIDNINDKSTGSFVDTIDELMI